MRAPPPPPSLPSSSYSMSLPLLLHVLTNLRFSYPLNTHVCTLLPRSCRATTTRIDEMMSWKTLLIVAMCVLAAALGAEAGRSDAKPQGGVYAPDAPAKKGVLAPAAGPDDGFMRFRRSALLSSRSKKGGGTDECENDADCSSGKYCNLALKDTECQKGSAAAGGGGGGW